MIEAKDQIEQALKHLGCPIHEWELTDELKARGLHIVSEADKAVLDAMGSVPEWILKSRRIAAFDGLGEACFAELGRRGEKA